MTDRQTYDHAWNEGFKAGSEFGLRQVVRENSAEYRMGWNDGQINEREACAMICDYYAKKMGVGSIVGKALIATAHEIRERKA